jgi:hypothetical protein
MIVSRFLRDDHGSAAAEMVLVLPILLSLMFGSLEVGNYFLSQHVLVKAVRDGARFAARHSFDDFPTCDASPPLTISDATEELVRTGQLSGGTDRLPNWDEATFTITTRCSPGVGGTTYTGLYLGMPEGAHFIEVSASLPYRSILGLIGLSSPSLTLNAREEAPVSGV